MLKNPLTRDLGLVGILSLLLVIMRWGDLGLPSYWDEAYPYAEAIHWQVNHGVSIMPGSIPPDLSTGHPLLYYTSQAAWMKLTGGGLFAARLFPLALSICLLFAVYRFGRRHLSREAGLVAAVLLFTKSAFFVQSTFMFPEVMLALFILLAFDAWLRRSWGWYFLYAGLAMITKEPGLVLALTLGPLSLFRGWRSGGWKEALKEGLLTSAPVLWPVAFFVAQKLTYGWFFFPRHLGSMAFDWERFMANFKWNYHDLTTWKGSSMITLVFVVSTVALAFQWRKIDSKQWGVLGLFLVFIVFMWLYSSVSLYASRRYILNIYPILFLMEAFVVIVALQVLWKYVGVGLLLVGAGLQMNATLRHDEWGDVTLGAFDRVRLMQDMIAWFQQNGYTDTSILAQYTLVNNMIFAGPGYLTEDKLMPKATNNPAAKFELVVENDFDVIYPEVKALLPKFKLLKRFERNGGWLEIYQVDPAVRDSAQAVWEANKPK